MPRRLSSIEVVWGGDFTWWRRIRGDSAPRVSAGQVDAPDAGIYGETTSKGQISCGGDIRLRLSIETGSTAGHRVTSYFSISHMTRRWWGWGWTSRFHGLDGWVVFRRNGGGERWYYNLGRMRGNCSCLRFDGPFSTRYDLGPSFRFMPRMLLSGDVTTGIRLHPTMGFRGW